MDKDLSDQQLPSGNQDPKPNVVEQSGAEDEVEDATASAVIKKNASNAPKKRRSVAKNKRLTHVKSHRANVKQAASRKKKSRAPAADNEDIPEISSPDQSSETVQGKSTSHQSADSNADRSVEHAIPTLVSSADAKPTPNANAPEKTAVLSSNDTPTGNTPGSIAELDVNEAQEDTAATSSAIEERTSNDQDDSNFARENHNESPRFGPMDNLHVDAHGNPLENPTRPQYLATDLGLSRQYLSSAVPVLVLPFGGTIEVGTDYGLESPEYEDY